MAKAITREELEAELQKLGIGSIVDDETLKTSKEWAELWNCNLSNVTRLLGHAKRLGLLEVGSKTTVRLDDKPQAVGAYRFRLEKSKAKKGANRAKNRS